MSEPASFRLPRLSAKLVRRALLVLGPVALGIAIVAIFFWPRGTVTSDNAYLQAGKVAVSANVSGRVDDVLVHENAHVAAGDVLFRIESARFEVAKDQAAAALAEARAEIAAMKARYRQQEAGLREAQAELAFASREFERQTRLGKTHVVSASQIDEVGLARDKAAASVAALTEELASLAAELGGDPSAPVESHPRYLGAKAALARAELDLADTVVRAPVSGIVTQSDDFLKGDHVEPGRPLFVLVETDRIWVEANLKETHITDLRPGQKARVTVDAYPGRSWNAVVVSLSPGTGSEFGILPPQNALGNWVKVTQRVPVRLALERREGDPPLRVGMSAGVEIETHGTAGADDGLAFASGGGRPAP
ncbi:MAG: HlyD family secretion protein [Alphaproteobacteria bacterium]|nr:HlyD family secretion protein [Alphaproteobacteria bacterium]